MGAHTTLVLDSKHTLPSSPLISQVLILSSHSPSPPPSPTILLPYEIVHHIASFLQTDPIALTQCTLVCQTWKEAVRPFVFRSVRVESWEKMEELENLLVRFPRVGYWIKEVRVDGMRGLLLGREVGVKASPSSSTSSGANAGIDTSVGGSVTEPLTQGHGRSSLKSFDLSSSSWIFHQSTSTSETFFPSPILTSRLHKLSSISFVNLRAFHPYKSGQFIRRVSMAFAPAVERLSFTNCVAHEGFYVACMHAFPNVKEVSVDGVKVDTTIGNEGLEVFKRTYLPSISHSPSLSPPPPVPTDRVIGGEFMVMAMVTPRTPFTRTRIFPPSSSSRNTTPTSTRSHVPTLTPSSSSSEESVGGDDYDHDHDDREDVLALSTSISRLVREEERQHKLRSVRISDHDFIGQDLRKVFDMKRLGRGGSVERLEVRCKGRLKAIDELSQRVFPEWGEGLKELKIGIGELPDPGYMIRYQLFWLPSLSHLKQLHTLELDTPTLSHKFVHLFLSSAQKWCPKLVVLILHISFSSPSDIDPLQYGKLDEQLEGFERLKEVRLRYTGELKDERVVRRCLGEVFGKLNVREKVRREVEGDGFGGSGERQLGQADAGFRLKLQMM